MCVWYGTMLNNDHISYFHRGDYENPRFWRRFGGIPNLRSKTVLDIGCGHGSMCVYMALAGAKKVVGVDINTELIEFAKENVELNYPEIKDKIEFLNVSLEKYNEDIVFDYIISKSSLEHVINLKQMMSEITKRLKVGGRFYTGFGPLYNSPYGDHKRTRMIIPWGHLIVPEKKIIKRLNKKSHEKINCIGDLGLNGLSYADYKSIFNDTKMNIVYFKTNNVDKQDKLYLYVPSIISSALCKIRALEEYFTFNIYMIMEKN